MTEDLIQRGPFVSMTRVRTPAVLSGGLTAWHIRQFVEALDEADIPNGATINHRQAHDTLHLIELSVKTQVTAAE